ncbi:MAG TPA: HD domain-containing protein [Bacteroidales bacterium]|nr:HD domain-containing protein [Bacteroidales bacterium]
MNETRLLLEALDYAALRHRNQLRKGSGRIPYINHPIQVANHLAAAGEADNIVLIVSAILHDVIEDTVEPGFTKEGLIAYIENKFGEDILSLILEVTDDKSLDKEERKRIQVELSTKRSLNARKLIIADKTMNIHDITEDPPPDWDHERITGYFDWAEKVISNVRGLNPVLDEAFDITLAKARKKYPSEQT